MKRTECEFLKRTPYVALRFLLLENNEPLVINAKFLRFHAFCITLEVPVRVPKLYPEGYKAKYATAKHV